MHAMVLLPRQRAIGKFFESQLSLWLKGYMLLEKYEYERAFLVRFTNFDYIFSDGLFLPFCDV